MVHTRSDRGFGTRGQETGAQVRRAGVELVEETPVRWRIERHGAMRVPGIVFASRALLPEVVEDRSMEQVVNVATLPGIVVASYAMPDVHWGYGFPIGGVAATDIEQGGVVSPGGVGFDISCGVRLLGSELHQADLPGCLPALMDQLAARIPKGMGRGAVRRLRGDAELDQVLAGGARWAVEQGAGGARDLDRCEDHGAVGDADPAQVSQRAHQRGMGQLGSLGSGNHFLEVQVVDAVHDQAVAAAFGLQAGQVTVMIHCGSRGLGHQIGTDYLKRMAIAAAGYGIALPDRELACAPINSEVGEEYLGAMRAAINCALANRQILTHLVRRVFADLLPQSRLPLLYDVSHNTCKVEEHRKRRLFVHRKGATRAFGPAHPEVPEPLRAAGQPVLIGGSMGTGSYVLAGTRESEALAFSSACHGAGRAMSRHQALRTWRGRAVVDELAARGILIRSPSMRGVAEEAPEAYKDVSAVVDAADAAGLARKVARLEPLVCIKG
jgi:tRNA-splicing ligase RtcB